MISKLIEMLGAVRAAVMTVTLVAVAVAMNRAGFGALPIAVVVGALIAVFVWAPFGAKYRGW